MKKILAIALVAMLGFSTQTFAQKKVTNRVITSENGTKMLTGEFNREALEEADFKGWYNQEYDSYEVEKSKLRALKGLRNYRIEVFIGTWCPDSRRELPRLYKILDDIKFSQNRLKVIGVNRQKKSFNGEEINKNIIRVPTIIVYNNKKEEVGRIVESPVSGYLEEDLAQIVNGTPLTPNYTNE